MSASSPVSNIGRAWLHVLRLPAPLLAAGLRLVCIYDLARLLHDHDGAGPGSAQSTLLPPGLRGEVTVDIAQGTATIDRADGDTPLHGAPGPGRHGIVL